MTFDVLLKDNQELIINMNAINLLNEMVIMLLLV